MLAIPGLSAGQDFLPVLNDNYIGVNQAFLQPASIADSRFKSDFNAGGFSSDIVSTGIRFKSRWLLDPTGILTNADWWDENTYLDKANGKDKSMFMSQSAIGPSLMVSMGSRHAFALTSRVRSITNVDGMDEPLFRMIYSNFSDKESLYWNRWYYDDNMRAVQHIFGDYGLTYARVFYDQREHFIKAGISLKLLQGIASSYLQTDQLYYYYDGAESSGAKPISWNSPYVQGGLSDNWGYWRPDGSYAFDMNFQLTARPSFGMDFGAVYEYRPRWMEHNNPKTGKPRADRNKYFIKVGISVVDLGRLKYVKDYHSSDLVTSFTPDYVNRYNSSDNSVPVNTSWLNAGSVDFTFRKYVPFADTMYRRYSSGQDLGVVRAKDNKEEFKVSLPTAFSIQADVYLIEGVYVNLTTYTALNQGYSKPAHNHYLTTVSVTPRYEQKWYGFALPIQVDQYGHFEAGLGVRAGIVYFGVSNLFSTVFEDPYGMKGYVGIKIPVPHKKDVVFLPEKEKPFEILLQTEPEEKEKEDKGRMVIIQDSFNNTIYTDDHSINISQPAQGPSQTTPAGQGVSGPASEGDQDNPPTDGINPVKRNPSEPGDDDGSDNKKGKDNGDGKGIDLLPKNSHIPDKISLLKSEENNGYLRPVYFAFGDSKNSFQSNAYLDSLALALKERPDLMVTIEGHTDNVGSDEFNMKLSKIRAEETRNYLIEKGVDAGQLAITWFGESKPLNESEKDTPEGRNKNRRVEFKLGNRT